MNNSGSFEQIDIRKAKELIDGDSVTIVDIRDAGSYQEAHIPKALAVNDANLKSFLSQANKDQPLLCYCYHAHSSQSAAHFFLQQGFKTVFSMVGGFEAWRIQYPVKEGNE